MQEIKNEKRVQKGRKMNLLFTLDQACQKYMKRCLLSLVSAANEDYAVYILHSDFQKEQQEELQREVWEFSSITLHFIYVDPLYFSAFPENKRFSKIIYYRIFASFFLPDELDRTLYLDSDIIAIRSPKTLYEMDFLDNYCLYTYMQISGQRKLSQTGTERDGSPYQYRGYDVQSYKAEGTADSI